MALRRRPLTRAVSGDRMSSPAPLMRRSLAWSAFALLASTSIGQPATQPAKPPAFDVASIRQNIDPQIHWRMQFTKDGVSAVDVTLQYALEEAYGLYDAQRWSGGPNWLATRRFNIEARFDPAEYPNITLDQRRAMLQQLLADRFKAVVHHEPKVFPVYALVVTKNGPKFSETRKDDLQPQTIYGSSCRIGGKPFHVEMKGCTMQDLASVLNGQLQSDLNRSIIDRTGLSGRYDFTLAWSAEDPATAERFHSDAPPIFSALPQQLGLKLKPAKGQLDTIVIDHIEMPSEN